MSIFGEGVENVDLLRGLLACFRKKIEANGIFMQSFIVCKATHVTYHFMFNATCFWVPQSFLLAAEGEATASKISFSKLRVGRVDT